VANFGVVQVAEDVNAESLVSDEADDGHHAVDATGVKVHRPTFVIVLEPPQTVGRPFRLGQPRGGIETFAHDELGLEELRPRRKSTHSTTFLPASPRPGSRFRSETSSALNCRTWIRIRADDTWSDPVNLGDTINTEGGLEYAPYVSPDGRCFFFIATRGRAAELAVPKLTAENLRELHNSPETGLPGIWWVEASFIDELRP
jgi:hypothetical protein